MSYSIRGNEVIFRNTNSANPSDIKLKSLMMLLQAPNLLPQSTLILQSKPPSSILVPASGKWNYQPTTSCSRIKMVVHG